MNRTLRLLCVWLMLLAVPFQGMAAAGMLACVPAIDSPLAAAGHDHAAMLAAQAGQDDHALVAHEAGKSDGHCGGSAACCVAAALPPALPRAPQICATPAKPAERPASTPGQVDLAALERPPKSIHS
jgi:hypothetical protein